MHVLTVMIKPASGKCNMSCEYCFYCDEMAHRIEPDHGFMSEDTLRNVIQKTISKADQCIYYSFQGGEPTLRGINFFRKAISLQKEYNENKIHIYNAFQTNGYALNNEWCQFFKDNNILVGISIDGIREIHDLYRRTKDHSSGTYDKILSNIKLLEQHGVEYNILTVVTKQAAQNISQIYHAYQNYGWGYQQYIDCLDPIDKSETALPYSLDAQSFGHYMVELFNLWYEDLQYGNQPYIRRFENYVAILTGRQPESCEQCGQCGMQIVVEADGFAYPCDFYMTDDYCLGNFNNDDLQDMDMMREKIGFITRSRKLPTSCKECRYYHICRGGCQRNRIYFPQDDSYHNRLCEGYRYFFDHCYERLAHIAKIIISYEKKSSEFS